MSSIPASAKAPAIEDTVRLCGSTSPISKLRMVSVVMPAWAASVGRGQPKAARAALHCCGVINLGIEFRVSCFAIPATKLAGRFAISYLSLPIPGELTALIRLRSRNQQKHLVFPRSSAPHRRGFFGVPSMIDSLEVEVLHPA
jgi:hypothetical protein